MSSEEIINKWNGDYTLDAKQNLFLSTMKRWEFIVWVIYEVKYYEDNAL